MHLLRLAARAGPRRWRHYELLHRLLLFPSPNRQPQHVQKPIATRQEKNARAISITNFAIGSIHAEKSFGRPHGAFRCTAALPRWNGDPDAGHHGSAAVPVVKLQSIRSPPCIWYLLNLKVPAHPAKWMVRLGIYYHPSHLATWP